MDFIELYLNIICPFIVGALLATMPYPRKHSMTWSDIREAIKKRGQYHEHEMHTSF